MLAFTAEFSVSGGSKQDFRSAHRASKVTSILEEGMPATDLSTESDISEIGILVAVLKFAPKARVLAHYLNFYFFAATYAEARD